MNKLRIDSGQMLIEIMVAVAIIGLVLIGVSDLITRSSRVGTFQRQRDEAFLIVERMLSEYRSQRDSNPQVFYDTVSSTTVDPCVAGKPYRCEVTVEKMPDSVAISIRAVWEEGGQTYDISLSQSLTRTIR